MDFDEYQELAKTTDVFPKDPYNMSVYDITDLIEYRTLCLNGEVGELANIVKKIRRDHNNILNGDVRKEIIHEIGDILWHVAILCDIIDVSMSLVARENIEMLADRKKRDAIQGNGDYR